MPGMMELMVILAIVVVLFGAKRLPQLGGAIGESIRNFRKGVKDPDEQAKLNSGEKKDTLPHNDHRQG
jgi:sec-independent protein translocase protein TatA